MKQRQSVTWFAGEMERKLQKHDGDRGVRGWEGMNPFDLIRRLDRERDELLLATDAHYARNADWQAVINESVDVANFAMMIADNARAWAREDGEAPHGS